MLPVVILISLLVVVVAVCLVGSPLFVEGKPRKNGSVPVHWHNSKKAKGEAGRDWQAFRGLGGRDGDLLYGAVLAVVAIAFAALIVLVVNLFS